MPNLTKKTLMKLCSWPIIFTRHKLLPQLSKPSESMLSRCRPSPWMRRNLPSHMPPLRWLLLVEEAEGIVVVAGPEIGAVVVAEEAATRTNPEANQMEANRSTKAPNIPTSHQESGRGVACIISGGGVLFSVQPQHHARGRMFTPRKIETGTSSARSTLI